MADRFRLSEGLVTVDWGMNGGSCTCGGYGRPGEPLVFDSSRCPLHAKGLGPARSADERTVLRTITHEVLEGPLATGGGRPFFIWIGWDWRFNVHSTETCRLCWTIGPLGFRWFR